MNKEHKPLTKWECGQELVKLADCLSYVDTEIYQDWPEIALKVQELRKQLVMIYNEHAMTDEMGFGI